MYKYPLLHFWTLFVFPVSIVSVVSSCIYKIDQILSQNQKKFILPIFSLMIEILLQMTIFISVYFEFKFVKLSPSFNCNLKLLSISILKWDRLNINYNRRFIVFHYPNFLLPLVLICVLLIDGRIYIQHWIYNILANDNFYLAILLN